MTAGQASVIVQAVTVLLAAGVVVVAVAVAVAIGSALDRRQARRLAKHYRNHR